MFFLQVPPPIKFISSNRITKISGKSYLLSSNIFCAPQWSFAMFESKTPLMNDFIVVVSCFLWWWMSMFTTFFPRYTLRFWTSNTCCRMIKIKQFWTFLAYICCIYLHSRIYFKSIYPLCQNLHLDQNQKLLRQLVWYIWLEI